MRATLSLPLVGIVLALPLVAYTALNGYAGTRLDVLLLYDALLRRHQHVPSLTFQSAVQPARATAASTGGTWSLAWSREGLSASWEEGGAQPVPLLQTAPGAAFVAAASSERVAAEARGCFLVRDRVVAACVAQRVDFVQAHDAELRLGGGFAPPGLVPLVPISAALSPLLALLHGIEHRVSPINHRVHLNVVEGGAVLQKTRRCTRRTRMASSPRRG